MPRKQRFKPSRKPKIMGTPTDLGTLANARAPVSGERPPIIPETPRDSGMGELSAAKYPPGPLDIDPGRQGGRAP